MYLQVIPSLDLNAKWSFSENSETLFYTHIQYRCFDQ